MTLENASEKTAIASAFKDDIVCIHMLKIYLVDLACIKAQTAYIFRKCKKCSSVI